MHALYSIILRSALAGGPLPIHRMHASPSNSTSDVAICAGFGSGDRGRDDINAIQLATQDFSNLPVFEKNFYHEHPAVTARSTEDVETYRKLRDIHVQGEGVPKPCTTFDEASFPGGYADRNCRATTCCRQRCHQDIDDCGSCPHSRAEVCMHVQALRLLFCSMERKR